MTQLQNAQHTTESILWHIQHNPRAMEFTDVDFLERHLNYVLNCLDDARRTYERDLVAREEAEADEKKALLEEKLREDKRLEQEYEDDLLEREYGLRFGRA